MKARIAAAAAGAALVACVGDRAPTPPDDGRPSAAISDVTHGGNPHFLWLRPIGSPGASLSGAFNAHVAPLLVVEICELPACTNIVATFTTADGLRVETEASLYHAEWHTRPSMLDPTSTYRIRVLLREQNPPDFEYGFADVNIRRNASELTDLDPDQFAGVVIGQTLPIRFRIDLGASCPADTDCVEAIVSPGTPVRLVTPDHTAVLEFDGDEVSEPVRVTLFRLEDLEPRTGHLGTDFPQYPLQYELLVNREDGSRLEAFIEPALYGTCLIDQDEDDQAEFHPPVPATVALGIGSDPADFLILEPGDPSEFLADGDLDCEGSVLFQPSESEPPIDALTPGSWRDLLARLAPAAVRLFAGEPLHASLVVRDALGGGVKDLPESPIGPVDTATTGIGDEVIFNATFTADGVGQPPGPPEIGSWTLVIDTDLSETPSGTILVQDGLGDVASRLVVIQRTSALGLNLQGFVSGPPPSTGTCTVSWRSLTTTSTADQLFGPVVIRDNAGLILASLEYRDAGALTYNSTSNPPSGIAVGTWATGVSQTFAILVDLDAATTSLSIDGVAVTAAQNQPFVQSAAANLNQVAFEIGLTTPQTLGWDDVNVLCSIPPAIE